MIIFSATVLAAVPSPGEMLKDVGNFLKDLLGGSGNLNANDQGVLAAMRIIFFILVFTVLYAAGRALHHVPALHHVYSHRIIVILALLLSAMTLLVTPPSLLVGLFELYGTIIISVFYITILAGVIYGIWRLPNTHWLWNCIKIALLLLLWYILYIVSSWVQGGL